MLQKIVIPDFENAAGEFQKINLFFQCFGPESADAPVVLVNHPLTGNSAVTGDWGWWKEIVGPERIIDTCRFRVICFDVPGNACDGGPASLIHNYSSFSLGDIARMFHIGLEKLGIHQVMAVIGGSLGGALAWEMAAQKPGFTDHLIPIATDYKATDWLLAQCAVQEHILRNSAKPVRDARMHAMTLYRTPQSFSMKFSRRRSSEKKYEVHQWLCYHGEKLEQRYHLSAYRMMNHLLSTTDISQGGEKHAAVASRIAGDIHIVAIDTDLLFPAEENRRAYQEISLLKKNIFYHEIKSIHGHDAFLIEFEQLAAILTPIFKIDYKEDENDKHSAVRTW